SEASKCDASVAVLKSRTLEVLDAHAVFHEFFRDGEAELRETAVCLPEIAEAMTEIVLGLWEVCKDGWIARFGGIGGLVALYRDGRGRGWHGRFGRSRRGWHASGRWQLRWRWRSGCLGDGRGGCGRRQSHRATGGPVAPDAVLRAEKCTPRIG